MSKANFYFSTLVQGATMPITVKNYQAEPTKVLVRVRRPAWQQYINY